MDTPEAQLISMGFIENVCSRTDRYALHFRGVEERRQVACAFLVGVLRWREVKFQ